jgi:hypothetical protein
MLLGIGLLWLLGVPGGIILILFLLWALGIVGR